MLQRITTSSRRSLIAATAAALALTKSVGAVTPVSNTEAAGKHYLHTGISSPGSLHTISGVETFDADLNQIGAVQVPDGVISYNPTGRSDIILLMTMFGSAIIDLASSSRADISWDGPDPGYVVPAFPDESIPFNPKYMLAQGFTASEVLLIDLETLEGRDISEFISNDSTSLLALIPDIPAEGYVGGVWTGDNVYLIDFEHPESAEALVGDDPEWYSTTLNLSFDGRWAIFTTYDPAEGGRIANVYLQDLTSGSHEQILTGHAWTTGFFIPNDPHHFMALSEDGLEYRSLDAPADPGDLVHSVGQMGVKSRWIKDGSQLLYGYRTVQDGPYSWILIDMESLEVQELAGLEDMKPYWPKLAHTRPEHLMFINDEANAEKVSIVGLDLNTGEVWDVLEDSVVLPNLHGLTASADGKWYTVSTVNQGRLIGTWLVDMESKSLHEFVQGEDRQFAEYAAVSPDGETVAVTMVQQPGTERSTWTAPVNDPDALTKLTDSVVMGWT